MSVNLQSLGAILAIVVLVVAIVGAALGHIPLLVAGLLVLLAVARLV